MKARIIKFLSVIFISLITLNSLSSCETTYAATTTDDMYSTSYYDDAVTVNIIMEYGTPYYIDGILQYYLYRNLYYYPYYYNNVMYFRSFYRPLPPRHHYNFGRPHRGDLRFGHHRPDGHRPNGHNPGHRPEHKPNPGHNPGHSNHNPNIDRHHNVQPQHGNSNQRFGNSRPNMNRQTIPNRTTPSIGSGSRTPNRSFSAPSMSSGSSMPSRSFSTPSHSGGSRSSAGSGGGRFGGRR